MTKVAVLIQNFWSGFLELREDLAKISTADDPVYDSALELLQKIDPGLYLEIMAQPGNCELIITADGKRELFPLVESIVTDAPQVDGWEMFALKPKLGFPVTATWECYGIDISEVVFDPLNREGGTDLGLRILIPNLSLTDRDKAHAAIVRAIDHGLGEREFVENIHYLEVAPLPNDEQAEKYIPLTDLEAYIAWHNKKYSN